MKKGSSYLFDWVQNIPLQMDTNGDILLVANKDDIIFINLISCLSVSLLLKQLSKLSALWRSKKYLFEKNFWKLLSKHLWLFLVKFYDFSIFFWTPLGEHLKYQLTLWEASSCVKSVQLWVISGPYFPIFGRHTGKYGPEITLYLDTFHAVIHSEFQS